MIKILFLMLFLSTNAFANSIIAKVNDEPISTFDLESYINMAIATGQMSSKNINENEILDTIIEQKVRLSLIDEMNMQITQHQIDSAINAIEAQSGQKPGSLIKVLKDKNIPISILSDKIKSDIGWYQVLSYRYGKNVSVGEEEVSDELKKMKNKYSRPHVLLYEIFIPVQSLMEDEQVYNLAKEIIAKVKIGNDFSEFASKYSASPSAKKGGEAGWLPISSLPEQFSKHLGKYEKGFISEPIGTANGYYVLMIKDKKNITNEAIAKQINKEMVEASLKSKKLEQFSKTYMRDLLSKSVIEKSE